MGRRRKTDDEYRTGVLNQKRHRDRVGDETPEFELPPIPARPEIDFVPNVPVDFDDLIEQNWGKPVLECLSIIPESLSVKEAKRWCWNESDEYAISQGCRFSFRRAMHFAYTCRNEFRLWENEWGADGGEPFILRSWEVECDLRIFGWVRPSEKYKGRWVRRFRKSATWIAKKNGKSPRGAAHALYFWKYDGEWKSRKEPSVGGGQHV